MALRTTRVECIVPKDRRDDYRELCVQSQRLQNRLWQIWLCHHANNGSAGKLRDHFDAFKRWKETGDGDKPQWPCKALEAPLTDSKDAMSFYRILSAEFPMLNARTRGLITNAWQSRLNKRKAASGSLPGWVAILFANESLPSFTRPQPLPFDYQNAVLHKTDEKIELVVRIEREEATGKSVGDRLPLLLNKRKARNARVVAERVLSGAYKWKGSSLLYDRGKFYILLAYELPQVERPALDESRVMWIRPGRKSPMRFRIGWMSRPYGGNGELARSMRERIENERKRRQEHNRWGGSNRKGHGRRHAEAIWARFSSRWKDGVKRYNQEITTRLLRIAAEEGCGRVVYLQPTGQTKETRLLTTAGAHEWTRTSWDYFQIGTMLAYKCEQLGIEYGVGKKKKEKRKVDATGKGGARKQRAKPNKNKGESKPLAQ